MGMKKRDREQAGKLHHLDTPHDHGLEVARIIGLFLLNLKHAEVLSPCHDCGFPWPLPFQTEDGHIACPDCEPGSW